MLCTIDVTYECCRRQILAKIRNSLNSLNIIARQNLLIYSIILPHVFSHDTFFPALIAIFINISRVSVANEDDVLMTIVTYAGKNQVSFPSLVVESFSHHSIFYG